MNGAWLYDGTSTKVEPGRVRMSAMSIQMKYNHILRGLSSDLSVSMRVLNFLDTVNRGGAEMLQLDVCRHAKDFGIEMFMATSLGGELENEFAGSGSQFFRLNRRLPIDLSLVRNLRRIIKKNRIEIVHGHQAVEGIHLYLASLGLDVKRVLTFHGFVPDKKNEKALQFLIPRMDANLVVSDGLRKTMAEDNGLELSESFLLFNGVSSERLVSSGSSVREELKIPEDALVVGMIGNFYRDPRKDQLTLVNALASISKQAPDVHCLLVGKTESGAAAYVDACRRICEDAGISNRVHFLGGRDDIPDILSSLDVFVLSSIHEGLPISLIEAMLMKLPCIVSDIPQLREVTDNGKAVATFGVGNVTDLSQQLLKILSNGDIREACAESAYAHATDNFTIQAHLKNLTAIYGRLLSA